MIAALPMYDLDALTADTDRLWQAVAERLTASCLTGVPAALTRGRHHFDLWRDPALLLGQACEYPLATLPGFDVRVVATPRYRAAGCAGARYRSAVVVRRADAAKILAGMRGSRYAVNEPSSNSGMNLLRATIAPVAAGDRFFSEVIVSGAHRRSLDLVAGGDADIAAIDCVTLAHVRRHEPWRVDALEILCWTGDSPSLPFVTSGATSEAGLAILRSALADVSKDPALADTRDRLLLDGFDFAPDGTFAEVRRLARLAAECGYPDLA
jgi:ABC-type phosphate/phosphonate transport system substrate-binding protein